MPQTPLGRVRERAFTHYYHPAIILSPPQLKILYETMMVLETQFIYGMQSFN